jgi:hypothetical protein
MQNQSIQQIKTEVERRVEQAIIPVLFDKLKRFHARRYLGGSVFCNCSFCILKRVASNAIANANKDRRKQLKNSYSARMKELFDVVL